MFETIIAAVDADQERAGKIVEVAQQMAQKFGSQVIVAHIRATERPAAVLAGAGRAGATAPAIPIESGVEARDLVDGAVERLSSSGIHARGEIGEGAGSTAQELLDIAERSRASLILVGDRDSRVSDLLLGGVANRIAHLAPCSVLIVR
jgi:nucleotide-binding universal stress UspA family protein